jgi:microsomal epoxide hydrolase
MATIEPFKIAVPESQIERLKQRLELTSFPNELEEPSWEYGSLPADVKRIAAYWKDEYDWRIAEAKLNELPHFKTTIHYDGEFDPIGLHFIHHKSGVKGAIPLLFVHGCT